MYSNYYSNSTGYSNNWMGSGVARYAFTNPFYTATSAATAATAVNQVYDYSQPIHVPAADYQETNDDLVNSERAIRRFDGSSPFNALTTRAHSTNSQRLSSNHRPRPTGRLCRLLPLQVEVAAIAIAAEAAFESSAVHFTRPGVIRAVDGCLAL